MINLFWSSLLTVLLLSGCGFNGTPTSHNDFVPLTSIEVVAESPAIEVSKTIAALTSTKLKVIGNYSNLFTRDITDQAVWTSSSTAVADFITTAKPIQVKGIAPGTATLTATVKGVSGTFALTVSNATVTSIAITPATVSVAQGLTKQFTAIGTFLDGTTQTTQDLTTDGATWNSSAPAVATVNNTGLATAVTATGTANITATFPGVTSNIAVLTATSPVPKSITVTPANPSILSLSTGSFQAKAIFSNNSTVDITNRATWTSFNSNVATITATGGSATTLSQGTTLITASLNGVSGTTNLNVTGGTLTGFTVTPADVTLVQGTVARMTATGTFSNGAKRDITKVVTFLPANTSLATVTPPAGNLVFLSAKAVTPLTTVTSSVTLPAGTLSATTNLTVTNPTPLTLTINLPTGFVYLTAETSARFTATATFSNGSTQDVTTSSTWTAGSAAIATVGDIGIAKGRVRGVATGTTNINATYVDAAGAPFTALPMTITVRTRVLQSSQPIISTLGVTSGNQVQFTATANYTDGTSKDVTEDTAWSPDNKNVLIMADDTNQPGQVVGVNGGTTRLAATFNGITTAVNITVP